MNVKLGLTFIFKDEYWFKKITLPAICILIPLIGQVVVAGWSLKIAKNVIDGIEEPLPDLDFVEDLKRGFFFLAIQIVYSVPIYLLQSIIVWLSTTLIQNVSMSIDEMSALTLFSFIFYGIILIFFMICAQIAQMNFITKNDLTAAFKLKEIWHLFTANPFDWILVYVIGTLLFFILSPLGLLACIIGLFFTITYISAVTSHLTGQAYLRSVQKGQLSANLPE
ncbi:DUF4013 domain-containing protein (plasmid) [Chloroflexota bacterium]|nr:DUF4013 domain-containing protein [Chloroflexota bacterium]